ncbi:hypothetical protein [Rhodobacter maris]|uniref:Uncharacterized protein n=1 Tax=Rhodobacter maris TaxID=446682 RepID=A0A285SCB1_9RHOB|nr:hypothetical protein [Rhodobacter maris]SOC05384.1 hypothetical protein SAMN05877831_104153 [Rhodobacter maris]
MSAIENLRVDEPVRLDPDRLVVIYAELGEIGAERVIAAAMEDLAVHLVAAQLAARDGQTDTLERAVREMVTLATQVGMVLLTRVAEDLLACIARRDFVAQAAVMARLVRIAERSLTAVWDIQDMRI